MRYFIIAISIFASLFGFSQQQLNPITWKADYIASSNLEGEITITANIEDKWHIYSQRATDAGPIPTSFTLTLNSNYQTIGKVDEKNAHEIFDKAFDAKLFTFEKEAVFTQKIKRINTKEFTIKITLEFMTCNDMQCLPPKIVELNVLVPTSILKSKL